MTAVLTIPTTAKDALSLARNILLTDGWIRGDFRCTTGGHCASGAIRAATGGYSRGTDVARPEDDEDGYPAYVDSTFALAESIQPGWQPKYIADEKAYYGDDHVIDKEELLDKAEDIIFDFNDHKVDRQTGRDEVIAKFDEAISAS